MVSLVKEGLIPEARIDEVRLLSPFTHPPTHPPTHPVRLTRYVSLSSNPPTHPPTYQSVRRILATKQWLGMLEDPLLERLLGPGTEALADSVGSEEDRTLSLDMARDSLVLVKNKGKTLPLAAGARVLLTGPGCHSLSRQTGGWSIHWQGAAEEEFTYGKTVYQGLRALLGNKNVTYVEDMEEAVRRVEKEEEKEMFDVVVACVGEAPYAEKPGDIDVLELPTEQVLLPERLKAAAAVATHNNHTLSVVVVLVEGRARVLGPSLPVYADAILHAGLPGPFGGQAIAEVLVGEVNPSGRLPFTYPKGTGTMLHQYHGKVSEKCTDPEDGFKIIECPVEWAFGHGLSYTSFAYSLPTLSASTLHETRDLNVSVTVTNTGKVAGKDAVLLFLTDYARQVSPEYKLLKRFAKTPLLQPGEAWTYTTTLSPAQDLSFWGVEEGVEGSTRSRELLENGLFYLAVGLAADCRTPTHGNGAGTEAGVAATCAPFWLELSDAYRPVCEAACAMWGKAAAYCGGETEETETWMRHWSTPGGRDACEAACRAEPPGATTAWDWAYVGCLEQQIYGKSCLHVTHCPYPSSTSARTLVEAVKDLRRRGHRRQHYHHNKPLLLRMDNKAAVGGGAASPVSSSSSSWVLAFAGGMAVACVGFVFVVGVMMAGGQGHLRGIRGAGGGIDL